MALKERFLKVYANLPLKVREEIVCVIGEDKPISWNVANLEVNNDTALGEEILEILEELAII
jgi:hypothetical protein